MGRDSDVGRSRPYVILPDEYAIDMGVPVPVTDVRTDVPDRGVDHDKVLIGSIVPLDTGPAVFLDRCLIFPTDHNIHQCSAQPI